jgi:predicted dehydrogenase
LGCGGVACQYHLRTLKRAPNARVVVVADPEPAARDRAVAMSGAKAFELAEHALAQPEVDAAIVCADNRVHASLAELTVNSGKHLYLEKPIALSLEDGRRVVEAARRNGVTATIGFNFRFHRLYLELRELLRCGQIGAVRAVRTRFFEPVPAERLNGWRGRRELGGGSLLDLGSHHLDLVRWLVADEIEDVASARLASVHSEHDSAWFSARTRGGTAVEGAFSYHSPRACTWEFVGKRARLTVDRHAGALRVVPLAVENGLRPHERARLRLSALPLLNREPTFRLAIDAFIQRLGGARRELPTLDDGLHSLESLFRIESRATIA